MNEYKHKVKNNNKMNEYRDKVKNITKMNEYKDKDNKDEIINDINQRMKMKKKPGYVSYPREIVNSKLDDFAYAEPFIFSKKQKRDFKVIPLRRIKIGKRKGETGNIRHFTPAAQE